jgi:hypothetical protein
MDHGFLNETYAMGQQPASHEAENLSRNQAQILKQQLDMIELKIIHLKQKKEGAQ